MRVLPKFDQFADRVLREKTFNCIGFGYVMSEFLDRIKHLTHF